MAEYDALVNRVTMWNVAVERQIRVKGADAEAFVNYVITRDASKIKPGNGKYCILCNEKGGILNDPVLLAECFKRMIFSDISVTFVKFISIFSSVISLKP